MRYRFRESALGASSTTPRARPQLSDARASSDTPVSRTALLPLGALAGALAALSGPHEGRSLAVRAREQEGSASPRSVPAGARVSGGSCPRPPPTHASVDDRERTAAVGVGVTRRF